MKLKYISFAILIAALAALIYVVPPVVETHPLIGAFVSTTALVAMAVCVFKGGLTDVSGK